MPERSLQERIESLEHNVEAIETLSARVTAVELQIVQLRDEMRHEFTATREEIRAGDERVRTDLRAEINSLRAEMRDGDQETRRYMRVLHEEVIARIALIQEGGSRGP
jgi:uncharacterized alpha-E superfamily protein